MLHPIQEMLDRLPDVDQTAGTIRLNLTNAILFLLK